MMLGIICSLLLTILHASNKGGMRVLAEAEFMLHCSCFPAEDRPHCSHCLHGRPVPEYRRFVPGHTLCSLSSNFALGTIPGTIPGKSLPSLC